MDVIFSGIQPSGDLTLGNYLGALKNFIPFQDKAECFYCIVNQHAITVPQDPKLLHERTRNLAALYIAAGLDPKKATIFVQSEVPEHALLGWMMICSTYVGEMERMTQYKSKAQKQEKKNGKKARVLLLQLRSVMNWCISRQLSRIVPSPAQLPQRRWARDRRSRGGSTPARAQ